MALGSKVRVLFLNDTARNGGPGRSLLSILKFLDPAQVHRTVILPREGVISELLSKANVVDDLGFEPLMVENPIEPWNRSMERSDFDAATPVKAVRFVGNIGRGAACVLRLSHAVRTRKIDLVYCNGTNANFAGGAVSAATGVPALWHVRYTSIPPGIRLVHDGLAKGRGVARIVCVSEASASLFPFARDKVAVIHNALDVDEFSRDRVVPKLRDELKIPKDHVIFGSFGRILPKKGYLEFIDAAKRTLDALSPDDRKRAWFVVLGDTPEDYVPDHLAECRARVAELGLSDRIHFLGFRDNVKPYVADFDVSVVPSIYPDPLPRAVIESMAFGLPVVAFAVGGVVEMIRDGETGRILENLDTVGMAKVLVEYFGNAELRKAHGEAARKLTVAKFDARVHAQAIQSEIFRAVGK